MKIRIPYGHIDASVEDLLGEIIEASQEGNDPTPEISTMAVQLRRAIQEDDRIDPIQVFELKGKAFGGEGNLRDCFFEDYMARFEPSERREMIEAHFCTKCFRFSRRSTLWGILCSESCDCSEDAGA